MRIQLGRRRPGARGGALLAAGIVAVLAAVAVVGSFQGSGTTPGRGGAGAGTANGSANGSASAPASGQASGLLPTMSPFATTSAIVSPPPVAAALPTCPAETDHFPAGYTAYHTYAGLCRALVAAAAAHSDIARLFSIGRSWQGREIWAMEISTHLGDGTHPPAVLFDGLTHGLEHLSLEMPLAIMGWLLDGFGHDATITGLVETRAIFIGFDVDPDGAAFDIAGGRFHEWRKNRQPEPDGAIGTDLNRNYADHWGCCGLVSSDPSNAYYRGVAPFSAPETRAVRDFVESLVFGGRQEIRAAISFHASGRLILWPYGYTRTAAPGDMTSSDHATFVALATAMARLNGYRAEQASSLYVDSGTARDWYYGAQGILAFTFELGTGTYQPSAAIAPELARNRTAILYLISMAGCPSQVTFGGSSC